MTIPAVAQIKFCTSETLDHPALQPLWERQRAYHGQLASPFAAVVGARDFSERCVELMGKSHHGRLRVDLAQDENNGAYVGYSIATVTEQTAGEIDSLFVDAQYRGQGIGDALMRRVLAWMDELDIRIRRISVAAGNEVVLGFYQRFGFSTKTHVMQYVPDCEEIVLAMPQDLPAVMELIAAAIQQMESVGIQQWDAVYPDAAKFSEDIQRQALFVMKQGEEMLAIIALDGEQSDSYAAINWQYAVERVLVVHRLAVHPSCQRRGVAQRMMAFAEHFGGANGYQAIRLDAFLENPRAVALYERLGYAKAGLLQFRKGAFWAFEKRICG